MYKKFFRCKIGWHLWETAEATYNNMGDELLGMPDTNATRKCLLCDKEQIQDIHCLGLNPPKYVKTWYNKND